MFPKGTFETDSELAVLMENPRMAARPVPSGYIEGVTETKLDVPHAFAQDAIIRAMKRAQDRMFQASRKLNDANFQRAQAEKDIEFQNKTYDELQDTLDLLGDH